MKDQYLNQLVITMAIGKLAEMLATGDDGGRDSEEEEEELVEWTSKLLKVIPVGYLPCT